MKIFICGQKSYGAAVMEALISDGHEIVGVSAAPQIKQYDKLKVAAIKHNIQLVKGAERLSYSDIPDGTDLIISAHSHWFISERAVRACRYGGIGFHPSLLPRHRGRDAVRWACEMGDAVTGASVYWLDNNVDGGDILIQRHIFIAKDWDYHRLWKEIFPIGVEIMREAVRLIAEGAAPHIPQDERFATWEPPHEVGRRLYRGDLPQIGAAK